MQTIVRGILVAAGMIISAGAPAQTKVQTYPAKSVRGIASVLPGDTCDVLVRVIGHGMVAQAAPDGYTLGCGNGGSMAIVPHAFIKVPYDALKDFTPIALMATNFMALAVGGGSQWRNVSDLVQQAKQQPGKVSFGSNGEGAFLHFATEMFRSQAGFTYLHVPFKGFPQLAGDLISGRLDASFGSFPAVLPYTQGGRVRILGIARATRLPNYPDIPTITEAVPGFVSGGWFGIIGPANIPRNIVDLLNREANAAMKLPELRDKFVSTGLDMFAESPGCFAKFIRDDHARYGRIAKEIGLKAQ